MGILNKLFKRKFESARSHEEMIELLDNVGFKIITLMNEELPSDEVSIENCLILLEKVKYAYRKTLRELEKENPIAPSMDSKLIDLAFGKLH